MQDRGVRDITGGGGHQRFPTCRPLVQAKKKGAYALCVLQYARYSTSTMACSWRRSVPVDWHCHERAECAGYNSIPRPVNNPFLGRIVCIGLSREVRRALPTVCKPCCRCWELCWDMSARSSCQVNQFLFDWGRGQCPRGSIKQRPDSHI